MKKIIYYYCFMYKDLYINKNYNLTPNMFEILDMDLKEKSQIKNIINKLEMNKYKSDISILKIKYTIKKDNNSHLIKDNCEILETVYKANYKEFLLGKLK